MARNKALARRIFAPILAGASLRDRACAGALIGIALTGLICARLPIYHGFTRRREGAKRLILRWVSAFFFPGGRPGPS